ncbi:MAG: LicD family protein [Ruminococcaceae bacterium]|nr:LicD family protein [Oscillospiraceae bacterium]
MSYKPDELKKVQAIEVEVLKEIIRICEKNKIEYFGFYGTVLGAVRHNGFIPWDDDIDIAMLRDDYDRFLEIAPSQLSPGFSLQHFTTEQDAPAYFAKVRKDGTKFVESNFKHLDIHHGIFVDVFPLDKIPTNVYAKKKHYYLTQLWLQAYLSKSLYKTAKHVTSNPFKRVCADAVRTILHILLLPVKKSWLFRQLDKSACKYRDSDSTLVSFCNTPWEWDSSWLLPTKKVPFEDTYIAIPANYDEVLKNRYGDYMKLPPEDKRVSHMPYELDFGSDGNK